MARSQAPDAPSNDKVAKANGRNAPPKIQNPWYSRYEVPRKTLHSSIGFATLAFYRYGATGLSLVRYIIPSLAIIISADLLRFNNAGFSRFYESVLGPLMRPSERQSWNGVIFYMLGAATVLYFLPDDIGALSIILLSWCDTAASTVGRAYGRHGPELRKGKSLIGSLAAVATGALTTFVFFGYAVRWRPDQTPSWTPSSPLSLGGLSILGGLVAAFSEFIDLFGLDDNLVIPVVSGGLLYALLVLLGLGR